MPRTITLSIASRKTDQVLERVHGIEGVTGITLLRGASIEPPGDVLTLHATNDGWLEVARVLDELDVLEDGSYVSSQPMSLVARPHQSTIDRETNESTWEEMASHLRSDSNLNVNSLVLMGFAGAIAAVGLWTNTLHVVVGAMIVAPGFEPILRIAFGASTRLMSMARSGILSTLASYAIMALVAGLTLILLRVVDPGSEPDLLTRPLVRFWSSVTYSSAMLATAAGAAGAFALAAQRTVVFPGIMVTLAVIPAMSLVGMGLASADLRLAFAAFSLWLAEFGLILVSGAAVFYAKRVMRHRRQAQA